MNKTVALLCMLSFSTFCFTMEHQNPNSILEKCPLSCTIALAYIDTIPKKEFNEFCIKAMENFTIHSGPRAQLNGIEIRNKINKEGFVFKTTLSLSKEDYDNLENFIPCSSDCPLMGTLLTAFNKSDKAHGSKLDEYTSFKAVHDPQETQTMVLLFKTQIPFEDLDTLIQSLKEQIHES
jgi:hypothetical protein